MRKLLDEYAIWLETNLDGEVHMAWRRRMENCTKEFKIDARFKQMNVPFDKCDPKYVSYFKLLIDRWGYLFGIAKKPPRSFMEIILKWLQELLQSLFGRRPQIMTKGGG